MCLEMAVSDRQYSGLGWGGFKCLLDYLDVYMFYHCFLWGGVELGSKYEYVHVFIFICMYMYMLICMCICMYMCV